MTKRIPLTQGKFALVDDEDFEYLNQWKWYSVSQPRYQKKDTFIAEGYLGKINGKYTRIKMHRLIMRAKKNQLIDHINNDPLDNRKSNLRFSNKSTNGMNRGCQKNTESKLKGAYRNHDRWMARIAVNGKDTYLGTYDTPEEAHEKYKKAALELHGEFAKW